MPELLSPAGSLKNMRYAFAYGADAIYAGLPRYSLRVRNNEFDLNNLSVGIQEAHDNQKQFYVVVNVAPHNRKLKTFVRDIQQIVDLQPDALIMSDPGLIMLAREHFPQQSLHLSVQANAVNYAAVKFWAKNGIKRVILSRELGLPEINEIRQECPDVELEVFVHGALCMAYSGRCLLSGYMNKRDPNQGACTNACRWEYSAQEATTDHVGNIVEKFSPNDKAEQPTLGLGSYTDKTFLLTEKMRPDEKMEAFEDEHGTYIMNSKDLRALQHVHELTRMGVDSLKIEGRTKSFYYCARTAQVYSQVMEAAKNGHEFNEDYLYELDKLASRGYTDGFLKRHTHDAYQNYEEGASCSDTQQLVGEVISFDDEKNVSIEVKNRFSVGDKLELMTPDGNYNFTLTNMRSLKNEAVNVAPGSGHKVKIQLPYSFKPQKYCILLRYLENGETTRGRVQVQN